MTARRPSQRTSRTAVRGGEERGSASKPRRRRGDDARPPRRSKPRSGKTPGTDTPNIGGLPVSVKGLLAVLLVAVIALVLVPVGLQWTQQRRDYRAVVSDVATATSRSEELQAELDAWDDPAYVEEQARRRIGYVSPGETQFSVSDAPTSETGSSAVPADGATIDKPWPLHVHDVLLAVDQPTPNQDVAVPKSVPVDNQSNE